MFIDSATIHVQAGAGGHGIVAFRRERFLPKGGPAGGDGGAGGEVIVAVDPQLGTLRDLHYKRHYKARRGGHGSGSNKHGANGESVTIRVPPGTVVKDNATDELLADLVADGDSVVVAQGGKGGFGNAHFKSARNRSPQDATDGQPAEERQISLQLKLLADVGLVGLPNAGKSTLLAALSAARPKIADYPFTTLEPHLGIVKYGNYKSLVMADIPGLIAGASQGKGLGLQFLQHIERTRLLLYLIDAVDPETVEEQLQTLQGELADYGPYLLDREALVVLTKRDIWQEEPDITALTENGHRVVSISAVTGEGLDELLAVVVAALAETEAALQAPESGESGLTQP